MTARQVYQRHPSLNTSEYSSALLPGCVGDDKERCGLFPRRPVGDKTRSFGHYENCKQCALSGYGYGADSQQCFGGNSVISKSGCLEHCNFRERLRSIYDPKVQASSCKGRRRVAAAAYAYVEPTRETACANKLGKYYPTYGSYRGKYDPNRYQPYNGFKWNRRPEVSYCSL